VYPKNIEAMKNWPHPKSLKILCGFLGLIGYYHKFVHNYGKNASPLTSLLKNNAFSWNPTTDHSFQALEEAMCMNPLLALLDFTKNVFLECGALGRGIG
jgi:hypothetical protein